MSLGTRFLLAIGLIQRTRLIQGAVAQLVLRQTVGRATVMQIAVAVVVAATTTITAAMAVAGWKQETEALSEEDEGKKDERKR